MEVLPGLHWVDRIWDTKVYVIIEDSRLVIVDAATPGRARAVYRHLEALGYPPEAVDEIWLTHADVDHMGSVAALKEGTGAKVVAHAADAPLIEGKADRELGSIPVGGSRHKLVNWTIRNILRFRPTEVDQLVEDGDDLAGWQVVHTPGHTAGSICFFQPERGILITGDAINHKLGRLGAPPTVFSIDMDQAHDSVRRIARLEFDVCCFGHGPPLISDASQRVQSLANSLP
jgi:glyoxylase-like metal-dependent hydrolase (beta-lactamase superfamily II)